MKILMTGGSSFTGMHSVEALLAKGHQLFCTSTTVLSNLTGLSRQRFDHILDRIVLIEECPFGSECFLDQIATENFDICWHHGAWTENYRSWDFNIHQAIQGNTFNCQQTLQHLKSHHCSNIVLTGSIFEGQDLNSPFTPYGLSKQMTRQMFEFYARQSNIHFGYIVIPNPFGPWDNPQKLMGYLLRHWFQGLCPSIFALKSIQDNIPVDLLALGISDWMLSWVEGRGQSILRPSGYVSTLEEFVQKIAYEVQNRYNIATPFQTDPQEHHQPSSLSNTQSFFPLYPCWNAQDFWDATLTYTCNQISPSASAHLLS